MSIEDIAIELLRVKIRRESGKCKGFEDLALRYRWMLEDRIDNLKKGINKNGKTNSS